jgi:hypothetical protein
VVSRHATTYQGQSAQDADVFLWGLPGQVLVVVFGKSAYIFEGYGTTAASYAHDYDILLDRFRLLPP